MTAAEWDTRVSLAACYRLLALDGLTDLIFTHASAALPGTEGEFLLNPYGMVFDEITASSLVKVNSAGPVHGDGGAQVIPAGLVIHGAIHATRPEVACVIHTHSLAGVAISTLKQGLLPISQHALRFYGRLGYHDYEGIAIEPDEGQRIVADLGQNHSLILRNHGLLTVGRNIAEAYVLIRQLELACQIQLAAQATGQELVIPPAAVCETSVRRFERTGRPGGEMEWPALLRKVDRLSPGYDK